ncbi:MAG: hypothetical protein EON95_07105 [Caulobacteraceae bacterium]|nr:MAG: hypothetical protein EON95_07105 [Caulobacteraceae bacterium]
MPRLCMALAALALMAFAGPSDDPRLLPRAYIVALQADPDANGGRPVAVDVVVSCDATVGRLLQTMTAAQWFAQRDQLSHASASLNITGWEILPGQQVGGRRAIARKCAKAAVVYANYASPGEHRLVLGRDSHVTVLLRRDGIALKD